MTPPEVERDEEGQWDVVHSVGVKVTHARLLRDKIRDGCPVCRGVDGSARGLDFE